MKKYLSLLIAFSIILMTFGLPVLADVKPDVKVIPELVGDSNSQALIYNIELIYDMGASNKNKTFSFLVSEGAVLNDATILAIDEVASDESGKLVINVTLDAPLTDTSVNPYKIYFNLKNPDAYVDTSDYRTIESLESHQSKINDITSGAGNLEDKINAHKDTLNLDVKYYDMLTDKSKVFEYLNANKGSINLLNINEYFDKASLFAYLYKGDTAKVYDMLYYYNKYLSLDSITYINMINTYNNADDNLKKAIASKLQSSYIKDVETAKAKLLESIIFASIEVLSKTELDKVFSDNQDYIYLNGYDNLSASVKNQILTEIKNKKNFETIEEISSFYNEKLNKMNSPSIPPASSGGGGGGGSQVAVGKNDTEPAKPTSPFYDISGHWAKDAVTKLYNMGIVNGKTDSTFEPDSPITREEFVKLISVAFGLEASESSLNFVDVKEDAWYYGYIRTAVANGLISGMDQYSFGTGMNIKREDIAVIISRYEKIKALNIETEKTFSDEQNISAYAVSGVKKLAALGIINGTPEGNFNPENTATRAEVCQILINLLEKI